jgi:hypothetical protein
MVIGPMAGGLTRNDVPGRHTRPPRSGRLRPVCLAALIMLVAQYGLGIFLNLYVPVPASDAHAGIIQEIDTAPATLTLHALLGLGLIGAAIVLLAGAVRARDRIITVLALAGLGAIGGAFVAGEAFVKNGQSGASFAMAALTGVALLCYVCVLAALPERRRGLALPLTGALPASAPYQEAARPLPRRPVAEPPLTAHRTAAWTPGVPVVPGRPVRAPRERDYPMAESPASWFNRD